MRKKLFLSISFVVMSMCVFADSPLTSCEFYTRYGSVPMVKTAICSEVITQQMMNYLANTKNPIASRVAVVNALGWYENSQNANKYLNMLKKRYGVTDEEGLAQKADAGTLITYAYLKGMSNIFDVIQAKRLADKAVEKDKDKSLTIRLIAAIIQGQYYMDDDWTEVYRVAANVINDSSLKKDMKQEAVNDIWNYMKGYGKY